MMTELLLRLRAGLPVSELPRRRHSAMIEQNVRIWSHTEWIHTGWILNKDRMFCLLAAHREDAECHPANDDDLGDGLVAVVSDCHLILVAVGHKFVLIYVLLLNLMSLLLILTDLV